MPGTRKLGRPTAHRMSMLRGMVTFLLEKGKIETTATRAAEVAALADKMITLGKKNTLVAKRQAIAFLKKESVVYKLFTKIAPLYDERTGGYTRVLKIGPRRGDGAEMAIVELVGAEKVFEEPKKGKAEAKAEPKAEAKAEPKKPAARKPRKAAPKAEPKEEPKEEAPAEEAKAEEAAE
ncbi:MAG: 50S ribosomal protein L17 [Clostridia bacterium]|nr:50S ribosomal protein L17 [Clostridia bacterium]